MTSIIKLTTVTLTIILLTMPLHAESRKGKFSTGVVAGFMKGSTEDHTTKFELSYGLNFGYFATDTIELGAKLLTTSYKKDILGVSWESTNTFIVANSSYRLDTILEGFYIGVNAGMSTRGFTYDSKEGDGYSAESFAYGVNTGYDYKVHDKVTVGAHALYLTSGETTKKYKEDGGHATITFPKISYISLMAGFKYWF